MHALEKICLLFYTEEAGPHRDEYAALLNWLVLLHGAEITGGEVSLTFDSCAALQSSAAGSCSALVGGASSSNEALAKKFLGEAFVLQLKRDVALHAACLVRKDRARAKAHTQTAQDSEFALRERIARAQEKFGMDDQLVNRDWEKVAIMLTSFLGEFANDHSLIILARGIYRLLTLQQEKLTYCIVVEICVDSLSQRCELVQKTLVDFLCAIASLHQPSPGNDQDQRLPLKWRIKPLLSNRTLSSLARRVHDAILEKKLAINRGHHDDQVINFQCDDNSCRRLNADGVHDLDASLAHSCKTLLCGGSFCM